MTSDIGTVWGLQIWSWNNQWRSYSTRSWGFQIRSVVCVFLWYPEPWQGTSTKRERQAFGPKALYKPNHTGHFSTVSVRTESPVQTEPHWSFQYCFNPETTSDVGTEWGPQIWSWNDQWCRNGVRSPDLIVCVVVSWCVSLFVGSRTVAKHERQAFGLKALYKPNHTGHFSTVLILKWPVT